MYEFEGEIFSTEDLNAIAKSKGYTFDELLSKNPTIKKAKEKTSEAGKPTSQGPGAPVAETAAPEIQPADTVSPSADGSLDLQEISLEEKKKLPYKTRQELSRKYTEKEKKPLSETDKENLSSDYFKAIKVSDEEIIDAFQQKYFKLDDIERPAEYDRAVGPGAVPTKRYINDYETDLKNHLIKQNKLKEYENYKETGNLSINEETSNSISTSLKYKKAQDYLSKLSEDQRINTQTILDEKKESVFALSKINKEISSDIESFNKTWDPIFKKRDKVLKELNDLEEKYGGPIVNDLGYSMHAPNVIEKHDTLVNELNKIQSEIDFDSVKIQQATITQKLEDYNSQIEELQPIIENSGDLAVGLKALKLNYSLTDRALKNLEKEVAGAMVLGAGALEFIINDDNILLDTKIKLLETDALNYYESLTNELDQDFAKAIKLEDVTADNIGRFAMETLADNALSIATVAMSGGTTAIARAGVKGAVGFAAKKAAAQTLKTASSAAKNLATGIFFGSSAGNKYGGISVAKKNAPEQIALLKEQLKTAEYDFQKKQIQNQIEFYQDNLNYSGLQIAASALTYGAMEGIGERFGSLRIVQGLGDMAKVAGKSGLKKLSYAGAQILKGVGVEEIEETITQLGQNAVDINILKQDQSYAEGIDKEFFVKTAITSFAIGSPAATSNIYNIASSELNTLQDIRKNKKLRDELINITNNLRDTNVSIPERKALNKRRNEILREAALANALNLHKVNKLSQQEFEQVFDLARKQRNKFKEIYELASSNLDIDFKNESAKRLKREYDLLDDQKNRLLNKETKSGEESQQIFNTGLFDFSTDLANELLPKEGTIIELTEDVINNLPTSEENKIKIAQNYAFFDGNNIYVNKNLIQAAIGRGGIEASYASVSPLHELGHIRLRKLGLISENNIKTNVKDFKNTISKILKSKEAQGKITKENLQVLEKRFDLYLEDGKYDAEEILMAMSDAVNIGALSLNDFNLEYDLKDVFNGITTQISPNFNLFAKLDTTDDIFNYIKNYNKSYLTSRVSLVGEDEEEKFKKDNKFSLANNVPQSQIDASKKAQELYEKVVINEAIPERNRDKAKADIVALFEPSVDRIVNKYRNRPGFNQMKEDLTYELLYGKSGVLDMVNKYDPKINDSLGAYINTYLERRSITIANKLLGKDEGSTFKSDVTEVKDVTATETAEDAVNVSEEIAKEKPKKEKPKLKETINFPAELTTEITSAVEKFASLASKGFTEETSKNRTSANYVNEIKADLAETLRKPIAKYIKGQGLEGFLIENREVILDNFTTTFLSKHPFFRKGILKRVNGEWVAPTKISAYKYGWIDKNGNNLKIDRDNASARGLTSGPEFIKRNPKIKEILKENEFVDYHFQDGALRNKIKANPLDSLSRQLAAEIGFEILQEDILSNGPISQKIGERASIYGVEFSDSLAEKVASSLDRGNIKFSKAGFKSILNTKLDPNQYYDFVGENNSKIKDFARKVFFEGDINKISDIFDETYPNLNISKKTKDEIIQVFKIFYQRRKTYLGLKERKISRTKLANKFSDYINNLVYESQSLEESIKNLTSFDISKLTEKEKEQTALSILNNFQNYLRIVENKSNVDAVKIAIRAFGRAFANGRSSFLKNNSKIYDLFVVNNNSLTQEEKNQFALKDVIGGKSIYFNEENVKGKFYAQRVSASDIDVEDTSKIDIKGRNNLTDDAQADITLIIKFLKYAHDVNEDNTDVGKISGQDLAVAATGLLSNMSTSLKMAARLEYIARVPGKTYKQYVYEHITPSSYLARAIIGYTMGLDDSITYDKVINILKNSKVALVPKSFDNMLIKGKLRQRFPKDYKIGENPLYRYFNAYSKGKFPKLVLENIIEGKPDITFENFKRFPDKPGDLQKFSRSMNTTFNEMLERKKGIAATETISKATAKLQGQGKGRFKIFVPASADDFVGLLYNFLGSGKQGDADMKFFEEKLLRPLAKAYSQLNAERQNIKQSWQNVVKSNKGITKTLRKENDYKYYTNDHAVRVWLWDKLGYDIPGINEADKAALIKSVNSNEKLLKFAEELIDVPNKKESWLQPEADWTADTVEMDLQEILSKIGRARIFEEFITNADIIFSESNLNKIEAAYGTNFRDNLETMLYRIKKGKAKSEGSNKIANTYLNWVRGSVATTMFFNTRSALLQQLSIVNFTNWEDNNIFAQGKFIAGSPKTYAKYWVDIFNSDWMKERRQGLKTDINESELVARLEGSKNKNKALLAYLLEKGFSLTKYGDNIAIATGGASFLYNREQKYIKEGMTEAKAKEEAFLDFQEIAEQTQQSSRQDLLSNQQVSIIGRIFLAFQNTTMQMTRLQKKAALDIINRRGSFKANISRLVYYGAIQNTIFSFLQNALFAGVFGDDEDENLKLDDKALRAANTVLDSALRGSGIGGAAVATLKNAIIAWAKENDKGWKADNSKVIIELLNISPALGIKARKINTAMNAYKYGKKVADDISFTNPNHPYYGIAGSLTSAAFNIPLDRVVTKAQNLQALTSQEAEAWQRTALFLGYNTWDLGLKDPEIEAAKKMTSRKKKKNKNW